MRRIAWHVATSALAAVALVACENSTSPSGALTQLEASAMAEQVMTDVGALPEGAGFNASSGVPLSAPIASPAGTEACTPTKSPASPANSDGDPVPDSVRFDFTGCTATDGSFTATLSGTIDFVDPTPSSTDHALRTRYTDFSRSLTNTATGKTRSAVENGVRTASGSADQLQLTETEFRTDYTFAEGGTASHVRTWSSTFTADVAGSIQAGSPLPAGNWNIAGTSSWTSGQRSYSIAVTTNPQLHFNPGCSVAPRFDAGTLSAVVVRNDVTTNVTVQFTACGQYTVTRS